MRRALAAGNWKMNGSRAALAELDALAAAHPDPGCDLLVCPPAPLLPPAAARVRGTSLSLGGQDCHPEAQGAHTGDISAGMLVEAGASHVILGHSERRADHGETSALVRAKAAAARAAGLVAIVCVGERLAERDAGRTLDVIEEQIQASVPDGATGDSLVLAYEPVWAIGTGRTATPGQIGEVHDTMRRLLERRFGLETGGAVRLIYGGSVKAENAAAIFGVPNVDGALVGGASLTAATFSPIVAALEAAQA